MDWKQNDSNKKLFCPLKTSEAKDNNVCDKEKCAWWDIGTNRCSIKVIAQNLYKQKDLGVGATIK